MEQIRSFLETVKVARKQVFRNLTLFPLLGPELLQPYFLTLEQALDQDLIHISEVSEGGHVLELLLANTGKTPVLIVEGEELVGAKQNRIVNATFLIAGNVETVIPVSCVEQGRWQYRSRQFESGGKMMHASLRRATKQSVRSSLVREQGYRSDQSQVWDNISAKATRMNVDSPTMAAADVFETYKGGLSEYTSNFRPVEHQVGALFALDGKIMGLEAFGYADTFGRFFEKLVKSYALDALESYAEKERTPSVPPAKAHDFLAAAIKGAGRQHTAIGLGTTWTFESRLLTGSALVDEARMLHLSAFRKMGGINSGKPGFQRFSRRRGSEMCNDSWYSREKAQNTQKNRICLTSSLFLEEYHGISTL